jgi:hypothetical protein
MLAAATLVSYDLWYKKVPGKTKVDEWIWIRVIEQSTRIGSKKVLASKHKGRQNSCIDTINTVQLTYLKQLYWYTMTLLREAAIYISLANAVNKKGNSENIPTEMKPLHLLTGWLKQ